MNNNLLMLSDYVGEKFWRIQLLRNKVNQNEESVSCILNCIHWVLKTLVTTTSICDWKKLPPTILQLLLAPKQPNHHFCPLENLKKKRKKRGPWIETLWTYKVRILIWQQFWVSQVKQNVYVLARRRGNWQHQISSEVWPFRRQVLLEIVIVTIRPVEKEKGIYMRNFCVNYCSIWSE